MPPARSRVLPFPAFQEYTHPEPGHLRDVTRCVFLDRDGVINKRRFLLVRRWGHFRFVPGVQHALARLAHLPVRIIVVTNQDLVGPGYIRETDLTHIHGEMVSAVNAVGGRIDAAYACVHAPWRECECRKPGTGMLQAAAERYGVRPEHSWIVGDQDKDMRAGRAWGCRTLLVDPRWRTRRQSAEAYADRVFPGSPAALEWLASEIEREVAGEAAGARSPG